MIFLIEKPISRAVKCVPILSTGVSWSLMNYILEKKINKIVAAYFEKIDILPFDLMPGARNYINI